MIVNFKGAAPPDRTSKFCYAKDNKSTYIASKNFSKNLSSCKNEKLSNICFLIFKVKLKDLLMLLESLFSNKISVINDNHVAIAIFLAIVIVIAYWCKAQKCIIWSTNTKSFFWKRGKTLKIFPRIGVSYKFVLNSSKSVNRIFWTIE